MRGWLTFSWSPVRAGDIGSDPREVEYEPLVPWEAPAVPVEPAVPAPSTEPQRTPERVPAGV